MYKPWLLTLFLFCLCIVITSKLNSHPALTQALLGSRSPSGCPTIGNVCADGSVYAGISPDGNRAMYTTPADAGLLMYNNGETTNYVNTPMVNCTSAGSYLETSCTTGASNTLILVNQSNAETPYEAASYCHNLIAHGWTDWYLPAAYELLVLYNNLTAIGGFNTSGSFPVGHYWSSSENSILSGVRIPFNNGNILTNHKHAALKVRCVRKQ